MDTFQQVLSTFGFLLRALGFLVLGFGVTRFMLDAYYKAAWQAQIALAVGFFLLLIGLTNYASPASMGTFALAAGAALVMQYMGKKEESKEEEHVKETKKK
ncbi:MAG: hypothetical protein IPG80_05845 [Anaerolineales bacterium]|jgi:hypothetical protein|uniref:hypothetical protein n=1 Tax=Candidatus Villigracilis vicinus TaxID=3140679 RepID=UPI003135330B|nr:hypothetical protein [Anaerolineales bacterium]MBK7448236.1 hypothetical protein [Anaerolineales bacterium]MBK9778672.1 hypothetical protein [Anaerolineales bacterium]